MRINEFQPKINVFGIGGCGNNIVHKIKADSRLSKILINTDISHLNISRSETTSLDAAILCGIKTCRGLGCAGKISKGYESAEESFSNIMYLFSHNQINIFIGGLGGGCGTGVTQFLLEKLKKWKDKHYNECNMVLCTFPLGIEQKRVKKAQTALRVISRYCDLIILIDMESCRQGLTKKLSVHDFFMEINMAVRDYITNLSRLSNKKLIRGVKSYNQKGKIIKITSPLDLNRYFLSEGMQ